MWSLISFSSSPYNNDQGDRIHRRCDRLFPVTLSGRSPMALLSEIHHTSTIHTSTTKCTVACLVLPINRGHVQCRAHYCNQTLASAQTHLQCVAANPNTPEPHTLPPLEKGDSRNAGIKSAVVKTGEMWNKIIRGCRISFCGQLGQSILLVEITKQGIKRTMVIILSSWRAGVISAG